MYWSLIIGGFLLINNSIACTIPTFANISVQSNFSLHHFLGIWYKIEWFSNALHNESDHWHDFTQSFEIDHHSSQYLRVLGKARLIHEEKCFSFGPWLILANNSAKMILENQDLNSTTNLHWPYYILKTDYNSYALIYGCRAENYILNNPCEEAILWILSRTIFLSEKDLNELNDYIENILCINLTKLERVSHGEKSCYTNTSFRFKFDSMNIILYFILLILYLFLIYK